MAITATLKTDTMTKTKRGATPPLIKKRKKQMQNKDDLITMHFASNHKDGEEYTIIHTASEWFYIAFERYMQGWDFDDITADICTEDASIYLDGITWRPPENEQTPYIKRFIADCA